MPTSEELMYRNDPQIQFEMQLRRDADITLRYLMRLTPEERRVQLHQIRAINEELWFMIRREIYYANSNPAIYEQAVQTPSPEDYIAASRERERRRRYSYRDERPISSLSGINRDIEALRHYDYDIREILLTNPTPISTFNNDIGYIPLPDSSKKEEPIYNKPAVKKKLETQEYIRRIDLED